MKRTSAVLAAIIAFGFVSSAGAADMPTKAPMAPMAPLPFVYNWTGFYVGINGGAGWARSSQTDATGTTTGDYHQSGSLVGATVGYNWQMANWVFGLEADWDWANINGTVSLPAMCIGGACFTNLRSIGTVRPRLGYAWDRWMVYATGGFAWGDIKVGQDACPATFCGSQTEAGWTVGAGVEAFVMPKWTVKLEYLYADFGNHVYYNPGSPVSAPEKVNIVRAGVNYHF